MTELTGWGRYPRRQTQLISAASPAEIRRAQALHPGSIARGNGRAYGDAAVG